MIAWIRRSGGARGAWITAAAIWLCFVVLCMGVSVNRGLSYADDAWFAIISKSLSRGLGYSTTFSMVGGAPAPVWFNPFTGTGPAVIVPLAAVLEVTGIHDVVPGITAVLIWSSVIGAIFVLLSREAAPWSLPWGIALFCIAVVSLFRDHFFQWGIFLGEVPAAAYLLLGTWLAVMAPWSRRSTFLSGLFLGLAFQTKYLALLGFAGPSVVVAIRVALARREKKPWLAPLATFASGIVLPTLVFEVWRLVSLGIQGYELNWAQCLAFLQTFSAGKDSGPMLLAKERLEVLSGQFYVNLPALLMLAAVAFYLMKARWNDRWTQLFAALLLSAGALSVYWLGFSNGWPRFEVIAVALLCFALSVPVYALPDRGQKLLYSLVLVIFLGNGLSQLPHDLATCENGLFHPTNMQVARSRIVAALCDLQKQGPIELEATSWTELVDVEFNLPGSMNFQPIEPQSGVEATASGAPPRRIVLINREHGALLRTEQPLDERAHAEAFFDAHIAKVLLKRGPYELLEMQPMPLYSSSGKKSGDPPIAATPNPVPAGPGLGKVTIEWDTGDDSPGEVVVSTGGQPDKRVGLEPRGSYEAEWINEWGVYKFRLYAGTDRKRCLGWVNVTRRIQ